jgi:hypothetical protein
MGKNTENLRSFMLWMGAHRLREKEWLDVFPFRDVVLNGYKMGDTPIFVDVGGGIGHQCKVFYITRKIGSQLMVQGGFGEISRAQGSRAPGR